MFPESLDSGNPERMNSSHCAIRVRVALVFVLLCACERCFAGPPNVWWTLSAADMHWPDLKKHLPGDYAKFPHLVDAWFQIRVEAYVKWFFEGLGIEWFWYVHCCVCF